MVCCLQTPERHTHMLAFSKLVRLSLKHVIAWGVFTVYDVELRFSFIKNETNMLQHDSATGHKASSMKTLFAKVEAEQSLDFNPTSTPLG